MSGYSIIIKEKIEDHITFIRINPDDLKITLREVFESLCDLCWLNSFDQEYITQSFRVRAEGTVEHIVENILAGDDSDSVTSDSGEYIISELSRKAIINELKYSDIPLGEFIKEQKSGNPGFDFYSENTNKILLFGEAKYLADRNAYGTAFKQIVRFIEEERDIADLVDLRDFCCEDALNNVTTNSKGFVAAFSSKEISTEKLITNIKNNKEFLELQKFQEVICVAVNI